MRTAKGFMFLLLSFICTISANGQTDGFVNIDGGVLHYKTYGSGQPLLIINGGPGLNCEGFIPLAQLLSDNYTTILYDQRGTGESALDAVDSTTITMDLMAQDIETLRKHLNLKEWIVLGHSFGGWMAEYYAVHYPDPIKAMILSSSGGIDLSVLKYVNANIQMRLSQTERDSLKYWSDRIAQGDTSYLAQYNKGNYLARAYLYDKQYVPKLAQRLAFGGNMVINKLVFKDLFKMGFDCKETLHDFSQPVLIIQGRQDLTGDAIAYEAHAVLPNSVMVFVNKSSHYSWWEQSEQYKSEVEKFITALD